MWGSTRKNFRSIFFLGGNLIRGRAASCVLPVALGAGLFDRAKWIHSSRDSFPGSVAKRPRFCSSSSRRVFSAKFNRRLGRVTGVQPGITFWSRAASRERQSALNPAVCSTKWKDPNWAFFFSTARFPAGSLDHEKAIKPQSGNLFTRFKSLMWVNTYAFLCLFVCLFVCY